MSKTVDTFSDIRRRLRNAETSRRTNEDHGPPRSGTTRPNRIPSQDVLQRIYTRSSGDPQKPPAKAERRGATCAENPKLSRNPSVEDCSHPQKKSASITIAIQRLQKGVPSPPGGSLWWFLVGARSG
ncbi:hypothetical protein A0H81_04319 [Grifola frondosa]|uniref:Uncharacterized protein n=1 Tax=Grifola frondosa TaxID=5627 RepID=A0A1C7MEL5_GRIFR|nr:hypothetical protein A0H81_04319 [Grifola frondosa]